MSDNSKHSQNFENELQFIEKTIARKGFALTLVTTQELEVLREKGYKLTRRGRNHDVGSLQSYEVRR